MTEKKEELEEMTPVGEGAQDEYEKPEDEDETGRKPEDDDDGDEDEDDDDEEEDEQLADDDDDDDEEKKERRRVERKTRRQRQKEARNRDKKELDFLRRRNEDLERRFSSEIADLDARIGQSESQQIDQLIAKKKADIKLADQVISKAISSQDGDAYSEAQNIRDGLRDELTRLSYAKQTIASRSERKAPDPALVNHAQNWMRDHSWWDPNGGDEDSRTVSRIDAQLVQEGLDPTTSEYWDELSNRVEEAMPHRYKSSNGDASKKKKKSQANKGPTFSTGGRERPLRKGEVYISPERRQAMEEAGVWDDPDLRQKYLRQYAKYDREHGINR
ncbi:hypothetical protein [[Eubacterium] cellulosolvens]